MEILLFGDQTADQYLLLQNAALQRNTPFVVAFVERSSKALREETRRLPHSRRERIPDFLHLSSLIEVYNEGHLKVPELESALATISQLGYYIG